MNAWRTRLIVHIATAATVEDLPFVIDHTMQRIVRHAAAAKWMDGDHLVAKDPEVSILATKRERNLLELEANQFSIVAIKQFRPTNLTKAFFIKCDSAVGSVVAHAKQDLCIFHRGIEHQRADRVGISAGRGAFLN